MMAFPVPPAKDGLSLLPGADFSDAFAFDMSEPVDAPEAARRVLTGMPGWARHLMTLRNALVGPLGLKTGATGTVARIGIFPILTATPSRVVLGLDDRHLDFRIVVDVVGTQVTLTTLVRRKAWYGWVYLALVMPFHKVIVPASLARVAQA